MVFIPAKTLKSEPSNYLVIVYDARIGKLSASHRQVYFQVFHRMDLPVIPVER